MKSFERLMESLHSWRGQDNEAMADVISDLHARVDTLESMLTTCFNNYPGGHPCGLCPGCHLLQAERKSNAIV